MIFILAHLFKQTAIVSDPNYTCIAVSQMPHTKTTGPVSNEVLLISGFGSEPINVDTRPLLERVLHASIQTKNSEWIISRPHSAQEQMRSQEINEITSTFNLITEKYKRLASQTGFPLGSAQLTYTLAKNFEAAKRIRESNPEFPLPWYSQLTARPVDILLMAIAKQLIASEKISTTPYVEQAFAIPHVEGMEPLNEDISKALSEYQSQASDYNKYVRAHGEPNWGDNHNQGSEVPAFGPLPVLDDGSTILVGHKDDDSNLRFTLKIFDANQNLCGGTSISFPWGNLTRVTIPASVANQQLTLSQECSSYLKFLTYRHSSIPDYFVNGKPIFSTIFTNKSNFEPNFYKPITHDPLSYFVSELIVKMAHALGFKKIVGDLPDALLPAFTRELESTNHLTVSQVQNLLVGNGLAVSTLGNVLIVEPIMPSIVEAARGSRKPYETALQLIRTNGILSLRQLAVFRSDTEIASAYLNSTLQPVETVPVFDQEQFKSAELGRLCSQPYLPFLGTLTEDEWPINLDEYTVFSNETLQREKWWNSFYISGSSIDPTLPVQIGGKYNSGSSFKLDDDPVVVFARQQERGYPIKIRVTHEQDYELEPSFVPPLLNPPWVSSFFTFGYRSNLAYSPAAIATVLRNILLAQPADKRDIFVQQYVKFKPVTHETLTYSVRYPNNAVRHGMVILNQESNGMVSIDQLPKSDQETILQIISGQQ